MERHVLRSTLSYFISIVSCGMVNLYVCTQRKGGRPRLMKVILFGILVVTLLVICVVFFVYPVYSTYYGVPCYEQNLEDARVFAEISSAPGSLAYLYLLYHDEKSRQRVVRATACACRFGACSNSRRHLAKLGTTSKIFESQVYSSILLPQYDTWKSFDYVIVETYKSMTAKRQSLGECAKLLRAARDGGWDVAPFLRSAHDLMPYAVEHHNASFEVAWDSLLLAMNYTAAQVAASHSIKPFYRNVYVIRPTMLYQLATLMVKAEAAAKISSVASSLSQDAHYKEGSVKAALRVFGAPNYELYPFVFERLPSFFLSTINARVCGPPDPLCPYNEFA